MTQQLDNNLRFKFVWLNSGELVHLQSRGLSIEVCGYLPISLGNKPDYLRDLVTGEASQEKSDTLFGIGDALVNYKTTDGNSTLNQTNYPLTFIFPGMSYTANGKYILPNTTAQYKNWLVHYEKHLFTNIRALNTAEMQFVAKDHDSDFGSMEQPAATGSLQLSYDISNETFGTTIRNSFYIDAVMLFGQAYNDRAYTDETQEEQLQRIVPLALVIYADDREMDGNDEAKQRPFIQPGKMNGVVQRETICVTLVQGDLNIQSIADNDDFKKWKEYAGRIHLVNDNLTTSAKFLLMGNRLTTKGLNKLETLGELSGSKTFAMHDRLYMGDFDNNLTDCNDDFSTPAMITCMTSAQGGFKNPQVIMGQIAKDPDEAGTGNVWDGVAHSYWTESVSGNSGSMYNIDWIGAKRPGINFFSNELLHLYTDTAKNAEESAAFGGGFQLMSNDESFASRYAANMFGTHNVLRGDAIAIGSQHIDFYQSGFNAPVNSDSLINNHSTGNLFLNSEYLSVQGTGGGTDYLTTIAADNISLFGTDSNINKKRRVSILNGEFQQIIDSNRVLMLNVKGKLQDGEWTHGGVSRSTNSLVANGYNMMSYANKSIIVGDANMLYGANSKRIAEGCQIYGSNNKISSVNTKYGSPIKITMIGHGLASDPKQQIFERSTEPSKTLILGQDNNVYTQLDTLNSVTLKSIRSGLKGAKGRKGIKGIAGSSDSFKWTDYSNDNIYPVAIKQVVVGGWKPSTTKHNIQHYNMAEFSVDNTILNDSIMTLMDVKGRAVDYTSRGLNVAVQEVHSQDNYDKYNFKQIGGINWAKLIQLLHRLEYDASTHIVKYNLSNKGLNDDDNLCQYYDTLDGSTNLYDLVRNDIGIGPVPANI